MSDYHNKCKKNGKHSLIEITRNKLSKNIYEVVMWCKECGSVVVDQEIDGRTKIGNMKFPEITISNKYKIEKI